MAAAAILDFQKLDILTVGPLYGGSVRHLPNFIKIGKTVAETWQFNGFQNGGHPPSWICEIQIL